MPFLRSATRPIAVQCFFCLSPSLLPPQLPPQSTTDDKGKGKGKGRGSGVAQVGTRWNWHCERCGCWNIKDEHGEMISSLPAMYNPSMNSRSLSLRAQPSSSHLPSSASSSSSSATSLFCRNCLANQTLIMNMLANYLPDDDDPTFASLYADLPGYLANLHARYPPVCHYCQPGVDEALRKSDHRAQVEAWSSALRRGAASTSTVDDEGGGSAGRVGWLDVLVWRVRGGMFYLGLAISWIQGILGSINPDGLQRILGQTQVMDDGPLSIPIPIPIPTALLLFHSLSILWIAWDPYWLQRVRTRDRTKVKGRDVWVRNMLCIMVLRILAAGAFWRKHPIKHNGAAVMTLKITFALEIALLIHSLLTIRVKKPVAIQLVRPVSLASSPITRSSFSNSPAPTYAGMSALSLGSQPVRQNNPIFGQASLQRQPASTTSGISGPEVEPMDWEPSPSAILANGGWTSRPNDWTPDEDSSHSSPIKNKYDWDHFATNKQRMFPQPPSGGDETGLESLLAGWGIGGGGGNTSGDGEDKGWAENGAKKRQRWYWIHRGWLS